MAEAIQKMDSEDFKIEGDLNAPPQELVKGPILPCVIGMCGSGVGFMKVILHLLHTNTKHLSKQGTRDHQWMLHAAFEMGRNIQALSEC